MTYQMLKAFDVGNSLTSVQASYDHLLSEAVILPE